MGKRLDVGDTLPEDIELPDKDGKPVRLGDLRGDKNMVLFFYPADETPGCTAEACAFRDAYEDFTDAGAEVIGVSGDPPDRHQGFASNHALPFTLLSDEDGSVRKRLGVPKTLGLFPGRVTYVIDKQGTVRHVFNSQMQATRHVDEALEVLQTLE